ncbi:hypothetical protein [Rubripirellula obstinata]|nr:hypothetical protein [Rubripirellula obstinata]
MKNQNYSKSEFWMCPAGQHRIKSGNMVGIGIKHRRQRTRSDNDRVLRAADQDVQAEKQADHRRSVSNAWLSVGFDYEVTES